MSSRRAVLPQLFGIANAGVEIFDSDLPGIVALNAHHDDHVTKTRLTIVSRDAYNG